MRQYAQAPIPHAHQSGGTCVTHGRMLCIAAVLTVTILTMVGIITASTSLLLEQQPGTHLTDDAHGAIATSSINTPPCCPHCTCSVSQDAAQRRWYTRTTTTHIAHENLKPLNTSANNLLSVSNELRIVHSDDRKSLGYTGQRKILMQDDGTVIVGYRRRFNDVYQIFTSALIPQHGQTYTIQNDIWPVSDDQLRVTQRVPALAEDPWNTTHLLWYGSSNAEQENARQIHYRRLSDTHMSEGDVISYVTGYAPWSEYWQEHPTIATGNPGMLYVAWEGRDAEHRNQQIKFSVSDNNGRTWSQWTNVRPDGEHTFSRPTLLYDEDRGRLYLFAYGSGATTHDSNQVQYTTSSDDGATWSSWTLLSNGVYDARHITVTHLGGEPLVVYRAQQKEGGPTQIMYNHFKDGAPTRSTRIHASQHYQFFPSVIAAHALNTFCVAWIEEDTSSDFPKDDPSDGDILLGCKEPAQQSDTFTVYNLTPTGSHLYPSLPIETWMQQFPVVYYDDDNGELIGRFVRLRAVVRD